MIARVVRFTGASGQDEEERRRHVRERVVPTLQTQTGFKSLLVLLDRAGGEVLGITLWEDEQAAAAAAQVMEPIRAQSSGAMGGESSIGIYEIIAQA